MACSPRQQFATKNAQIYRTSDQLDTCAAFKGQAHDTSTAVSAVIPVQATNGYMIE